MVTSWASHAREFGQAATAVGAGPAEVNTSKIIEQSGLDPKKLVAEDQA